MKSKAIGTGWEQCLYETELSALSKAEIKEIQEHVKALPAMGPLSIAGIIRVMMYREKEGPGAH